MILISVVIPTLNNAKVLEKALRAFECQSISRRIFEIVVIDDGSNGNEIEKTQEVINKMRMRVVFYKQKHAGPATARNLGIKKARGKIILLVNDDTIPSLNFIRGHLAFHLKYPKKEYGLLSNLTWHSDLEITPFMKWLKNGGPYFSFFRILKRQITWKFFWTCGVSVKKELLEEAGFFDEEFLYAGWEDIELGYRLAQKGLNLKFDPTITAFHYHPVTVSSIRKKMMVNGEMLWVLRRKIPRSVLPPLANYSKLAIIADSIFFCKPLFFILEKLAFYSEKKFSFSLLYTLVLLHYRTEGLKKSCQQNR